MGAEFGELNKIRQDFYIKYLLMTDDRCLKRLMNTGSTGDRNIFGTGLVNTLSGMKYFLLKI